MENGCIILKLILNIPDLADMTKDEIKRNYDVLITYLSPFYDGALHLPH